MERNKLLGVILACGWVLSSLCMVAIGETVAVMRIGKSMVENDVVFCHPTYNAIGQRIGAEPSPINFTLEYFDG